MLILYVENDPMNRRVIRSMLGVAGVRMDEAADAQTGLRLVDTGDYALVLMDLRMPGMSGVEAIKKIRLRNDAKSETPILVVTADISHDIRQTCLAAGANDLLMKPVTMNVLFKTMGEMIANHAVRQMH